MAGEPLDTSQARQAVSGHRRKREVAKATERKMDPLNPKQLHAMIETLDLDELRGLRDRALLLIGFATACRRVELAYLDLGDIEPCEDGLLVRVYRRKLRKVTQVAVLYGQHALTCPVRAWKAFSEALTAEGHTDTDLPAFPRIGRDGTIGGQAAGRGSADGRMTGGGIATIICRAADRAGSEGDIGGHSHPPGFASARVAGADHLAIARQGGWTDGSRAVFGYMDEVDRFGQDNPLCGIGL